MARRSRIRGDTPSIAAVPETAAIGGTWRVLGKGQVTQIADAALEILTKIGLSEAPPVVIEAITAKGGRLRGGRLYFPAPFVQETIQNARREVLLAGQDATYDMQVGGVRCYTGTGGAAPNILDLESETYRASTLADLYDAARLTDALSHIHFFSRSLVARDIEDPYALDLNTAFAALTGTSKHVMVQASDPAHVAPIAKMCHTIAGSEAAFRSRPFLSLNVNHIVPPLRFHAQSAEVMAEAVHFGIPVHCNVFGQLGASSPVTSAGSVAQTLAEVLAGMVFAYALNPQAAMIAGPRPMITDLRTGGFSGGSGEQALATAMCVQVLRHWKLPCSVIAGATDAKMPDAQAGYEKALTVLSAIQAGANLVTQAAGMQAGLMGVSHAAYVIDNDMLGSLLRANIAPEVSPETLAMDTIRKVVAGDGHFLGQPETYARMKSDFLYPEIGCRLSIDEWADAGRSDIVQVAKTRAVEILASHFPTHVDDTIATSLISDHDVRLTLEQIKGLCP